MKSTALGVKIAVFLLVWQCTDAQTCDPFSIRLMGLGVISAGRVEICMDGEWGTVCNSDSDPWSLKNAQVVCRQLGYSVAINSLPQNSLTLPISDIPIHLSEVECTGTETSLQQCSYSSRPPASCNNFTLAAIVCKPGFTSSGDVRLVGADSADYRGAIEYYDPVLLRWTGVCADSTHSSSWITNQAAAEVVCAQLGYDGGRPFIQSSNSLFLGVADLECGERSFSLSDCTPNRIGATITGCTTQEAGWVECREADEEDFSIRLVGGSREGIVEVALNGRWGTICEDEEWDTDNAMVACEELGFTTEDGYSITPSTSYRQYMSDVKPSWLSMVSCLPAIDDSIRQCSKRRHLGYTSCSVASATSVFNSAEVNCGSPIPFKLSGGQVAGIVVGSIVFVGLVILALIYLPERWKKRHTYPFWRKLTTPSRWCENMHMPRNIFHHQRRCSPVATISQNGTTAEVAPRARTSATQEEREETRNRPSPAPAPPPPAEPETQRDLTAVAPPSYQAAVNYQTASEDNLKPPLPPVYTPTPDPYPTAAYPPIPDPTAPYPPIPDPTAAYPPIPDPTAAYPPIPDPTAAYPPIPDPTAAYPPIPDPTEAYPPFR